MITERRKKYAQNEVALARLYLETNPDDDVQKDRLAWWSAVLGDLETAKEHAVSDKVKQYIEQCETC